MYTRYAIALAAAFALLTPLRGLPADDLEALAARAATYESGASVEPLRTFERLLNASVGDAERRAELEAALIRLLAPASTYEAKRFACTQLAVHGSDAALPALAELLRREETAGIACFALAGLRSERAGDVLRSALAESHGATLLHLANALGHRAEAASAAPLAALARAPDSAAACAAIRALGAIDAPQARKAVEALRGEAVPALAEAVAEASLSGAIQLAASGERRAAIALGEAVLATSKARQVRRGAFSLLLRSDKDGGEARIRSCLEAAPADLELAAVAIARMPALKGRRVSKTFGSVLPRLPPALQVLLVEAFACRADSDARAVICSQVGAADAGVRRAAVAAAGKLEASPAVPLLASALASARSPEEAHEVQLALAGLQGGEETDRALCAELRRAAGENKAPIMEVLSRRGGKEAAEALLEFACGADAAVARAAAQSLTRLADSGDAQSLVAVQAALSCGEPRVRETALRALAAWRGPAAWDTLAGVYLKPANGAERALALRGLIRLAGDRSAPPDDALIGRYRQLMAGASGDEERRQILRVLAGVGHPDALALALPLLDAPGVRAEAVDAVRRIAGAIQAAHPDVARSALKRAEDAAL